MSSKMVLSERANWDLGPHPPVPPPPLPLPCKAIAKGEITSVCASAGRFATSSCSCHKMLASFDKYPHRLENREYNKQAISNHR